MVRSGRIAVENRARRHGWEFRCCCITSNRHLVKKLSGVVAELRHTLESLGQKGYGSAFFMQSLHIAMIDEFKADLKHW